MSAATLSTEPLAAETGSQKESFKEHIGLLERVSSYLFNEKKNDFLVPAPGKLSEDFSSLNKEIMPSTQCRNRPNLRFGFGSIRRSGIFW